MYVYHQNQLLRLSTALTVVATRGIWPYMAANALRHLDLCKLWPFKLLMPLDPISNILPAVISKDTDVRKILLNETNNWMDSTCAILICTHPLMLFWLIVLFLS